MGHRIAPALRSRHEKQTQHHQHPARVAHEAHCTPSTLGSRDCAAGEYRGHVIPLPAGATKTLGGAHQRMISAQTDEPALVRRTPQSASDEPPSRARRRTDVMGTNRTKEAWSSHGTPTKGRPDFPARRSKSYARRTIPSSQLRAVNSAPSRTH